MKKITLLPIAILFLVFSWQSNAQYTFAPAGPVNVVAGTPVNLSINNAANTAAAPAGTYTDFYISVDWADGFNAWSNEAYLTVVTSSGSVVVNPATSGAASSGADTTLAFFGSFAGDYNPSVDGTLNLILNQSYAGSDADWSNITVSIFSGTPATPDCATTPFPIDGAVDVPIGELTLTWTAPASGPTPTAYNIYAYDDAAGANPALILTTSNTSADVIVNAFGIDVFWAAIPVYLTEEATGCAVWSFTIEDAPPAPGNNDCSGAVALIPGSAFEAYSVVGSINGATGSGQLPLPGCAAYDPADTSGFGGDVWYSVVVPADGNLTIETNGNPTGNDGDSGMAVYTGACGALSLFECDDDDSADGLYSLVSIETADGLANQTVYIRVWEYDGDEPFTFQVSAHSSTLSIIDLDVNSNFTYYPNPVKSTLNLKSQSNIQNVSIYNMLGQEVLRTSPNTLISEVDMASLQTGAYFVKVSTEDGTESIRVLKQ